jgi:hypothetical protein
VLDGTTITEGSANAGVAIYIEDTGDGGSQLDMVNSTISGTSTDPGIGAIHMIATIAELLHVTMAENALDIIASQTSLQVTGSLFEGGCQLVIGTIVQTGGTNLGLDPTCWDGLPGPGDLVVANLLLGALDPEGGPTPTYLPKPGSPVVDHVAGPCLPTDQRRKTRPATECDSGSVEQEPLEIFSDGFESGDTTAWSSTVP